MSIMLPREFDTKLAASLANECLHITPTSVKACSKGMYNSVFYIDSDIGRVVLKVAPDPNIPCMTSEINMLAAEIDALRRAKWLGIPLPEPLAVDESINPRFFFMTYIEGECLCGLTERLDKWMLEAFRDELLWLGTK